MITFEIARTGFTSVEVSWDAKFGPLCEPVYYLLAQCLGNLEPVESVEVLKFSAHLRILIPTDQVLETLRQALLESDDLKQVILEPYQVLLPQPTY